MTDHLITSIAQYACIIKDKKVLLLLATKTPFWAFPGGRLNVDDTDAKTALAREIFEETRLVLIDAKPIDVRIWTDMKMDRRTSIQYVCTVNVAPIVLSHEHKDAAWFTYEQAKELFTDQRVKIAADILESLRLGGYL